MPAIKNGVSLICTGLRSGNRGRCDSVADTFGKRFDAVVIQQIPDTIDRFRRFKRTRINPINSATVGVTLFYLGAHTQQSDLTFPALSVIQSRERTGLQNVYAGRDDPWFRFGFSLSCVHFVVSYATNF